MLPKTLTFCRHGLCEDDVVLPDEDEESADERRLREGVHTSKRRLVVPRGVDHGKAVGEWFRDWFFASYSENDLAAYASPYVRTLESAAHSNLGLQWQIDQRIKGRDWGRLDFQPRSNRELYYQRENAYDEVTRHHQLFGRSAESVEGLAEMRWRLESFVQLLQQTEVEHAIVFTHAEVILLSRYLIEWRRPLQFGNFVASMHNQQMKIRNARIVQYSRFRDDETFANGDPSGLAPDFIRVRFVNPIDPEDPATNRDWEMIQPRADADRILDPILSSGNDSSAPTSPSNLYTEEQLLAEVEYYPHVLPQILTR